MKKTTVVETEYDDLDRVSKVTTTVTEEVVAISWPKTGWPKDVDSLFDRVFGKTRETK